jgi:ABC-type glycerol-3-phosphate transport system permease component
LGWSFFTIFALSWIVLASFKTSREIFREPFKLPAEIQWENYVNAWNSVRLGDYFFNSVIIVAISLVILLAVSAPAAYALSRFKFRGVGILTTIYILGIGIPYPLLFIPLFGLLTALRVINTLPGLILVYVSLSIPFTVFLLTGFFATLPRELEEASLIDGCSNWQTFRLVMLPLAAPGLLTAAIFNGIGLWNEYQLALVFINNPDNRTLSLGLYAMQNAMQYTGDWPGLFAGVVIVMIPTIILFIILSERMISGITMGAVK